MLCEHKKSGEVRGDFHALGDNLGEQLDPAKNFLGIRWILSMQAENVRKSICILHKLLQGNPGSPVPIENGVSAARLQGWSHERGLDKTALGDHINVFPFTCG